MKVVINTCFGGFGLSMEAEKAYLKRKGKECFHYENIVGPRGGMDIAKYRRATRDAGLMIVTATKDLGDTTTSEELYGEAWFDGRSVERHDPDLVAVVEELGNRAAGSHAALKVVEVPDGVDYFIDEYDGREHVAEKHRTWS